MHAPALAPEVRPALALRFVLGVPTEVIARLFLIPRPVMKARLTRARARLVAARHADAATEAVTDWAAIAAIYRQLGELTGSPVVRLNRAVAVANASGPMVGLVVLKDAASSQHPQQAVAALQQRAQGTPYKVTPTATGAQVEYTSLTRSGARSSPATD